MDSEEKRRAVARLRVAFELFAAGEAMKRQQLRREDPCATDAEIEEQLISWLQERPGAEHGDAEGVPGTWPRTRC